MSPQSLAIPDAPKAMSFRTTVRQHELMAEAAKQEGMSLNAWMKEQLEKAVATVSTQIEDLPPAQTASIRTLLHSADDKIDLVDRLLDFVEDDSPRAILRFSNALNQYLIGLDSIRPYWQRAAHKSTTAEDSSNAKHLETGPESLTRSLVFLLGGFSEVGDLTEAAEVSNAIRLYVAGLQVILPFLTGQPEVTAVEFLRVVEECLVELEASGDIPETEDVLNKSKSAAKDTQKTRSSSKAGITT